MRVNEEFYNNISITNFVSVSSGSPRQTSTGTLTVIVSDANDNTPAFQHGSYATYLSENEPASTSVLQVSASDSDASRNAKIR